MRARSGERTLAHSTVKSQLAGTEATGYVNPPSFTRSTLEADLDAAMDLVIAFATDRLDAVGEFFPFGAVVEANGEAAFVAAHPGQERPEAADVTELLETALAERALGKVRAVAIASDVRIDLSEHGGGQLDAIYVHFEHALGEAREYYVPYRKRRLRPLQLRAPEWEPGELRFLSGRSSVAERDRDTD